MKQQKTRELLVTTKVAQHWTDDFEQQVDDLISLVCKVDNEGQVQQATEMLDVYHTNKPKASSRRKKMSNVRPFEFLVFRN